MDEICGIININKESGWTSFDVVSKLRRILGIKKIGHTGTLDPMARGVLPVCVGKKATRLSQSLTHKDKIYETTLLLGTTTDTLDITGKLISTCNNYPKRDTLIEIIKSFEGPQSQIPPMYSAKKIKGKKLYELARAGQIVERKPVEINIYSIDILNIDIPRVSLRISASSGTYIRSICDDIGKKVGCGGCMENLVRIKSGDFDISNSYTIAQVEKMALEGDYSFLGSIDGIC